MKSMNIKDNREHHDNHKLFLLTISDLITNQLHSCKKLNKDEILEMYYQLTQDKNIICKLLGTINGVYNRQGLDEIMEQPCSQKFVKNAVNNYIKKRKSYFTHKEEIM